MKIVFVHNALESLGVEHLSAFLKQAGHQTFLVFDPSIGMSFRYFNSYITKCFSQKEAIIRKVVALGPDLVCFSVYSDNYTWACDMAQEIKKYSSVPVMFGGVHPTLVPERVIKKPFVDFVCEGDGEISLLALLDALNIKLMPDQFQNIWYKKEGVIRSPLGAGFVKEVETLPAADKNIFWQENHLFINSVYTVVTGRHCVYACTYCHNSYLKQHFKGNYQQARRSVGGVIAELLAAKKQYNMKRVAFFDDLFISDREWLMSFLKKYKEEIALPFFCTAHPKLVNSAIINALKEAGCSSINLGVQTINEELRRNVLGRCESNEEIKEAIRLIEEANIFLFTNIIFGLPGQDELEMVNIIRFFNDNRPDFADSNWLRYYPRTKMTDLAVAQGLLSQEDLEDIEEGRVFKPYSMGGHTRNKLNSKLRNLLSCLVLMPRLWVNFVLDKKLYNYFPAFDVRGLAVLLAIFKQKVFSNKMNPYPHMSVNDILMFHVIYIGRALKSRFWHVK